MSSFSTAAVEFVQVSKSFSSKTDHLPTPVLQQISGSIPQGSITTLIGPSGSGKSTLLSLCNLLLSPDKGEVLIQGKSIHTWQINQLRRTVGMVFQDSPVLPGTVKDNILTASRLHNTPADDPVVWLERAGLSADLLDRPAQELSGGQKQRLALIRTLAGHPQILLLDEITSALDPGSVHAIEQMLFTLNREQQTTLIWVTHQLEQAQRVSQYTWFLENGQLVETGTSADFFAHPQTEAARHFIHSSSQSEDA